jgi:hypothetical protein
LRASIAAAAKKTEMAMEEGVTVVYMYMMLVSSL